MKSTAASKVRGTLGVIGVGTIGNAIIEGLINNDTMKSSQIVGSTAHQVTAEKASEKLNIEILTDNKTLVRKSDFLLLAVKPQVMAVVTEEIGKLVTEEQLIISVAAAVETNYIESRLKSKVAVIRAMPNTPVTVNEGITVLCPGQLATEDDIELARKLFTPVGRVKLLQEEQLMNAVTGLSGSGPAYGYLIIEALIEAGVKVGLPRQLATTLASQSLLGAAKMVLATGEHPAMLKDMVTTPAGTTVDGIMKLEEGGVRVAMIKAIVKATEKAEELNLR
ncbi:MAG: pyrroline-5-carboxylate reductase [Candidatus Acetothermia bacterium]